MSEILILRGLHPSKIEELVGYYQWFPKLTVSKHNKMISEILKQRKRNVLSDFLEFISDLNIVSERYVAKADHEYSQELLYKVFLWYLYHRFVNKYDYLRNV